jgi:CHAT domain-containing protein/tetratricopeptide (TPR) repeat protein
MVGHGDTSGGLGPQFHGTFGATEAVMETSIGEPGSGGLPPAPPAGALRLATALSVATRIEPELMRSMRLTVFPDLDVGAESDLWFSEWVVSRSPGGIVLLAAALPVLRAGLRQMLRADPSSDNPVSRVWQVISHAHRDLSPALWLEERVTWLAVKGGDDRAEIEDELRKAVVALADEDRTGIADWLADAWSRFPPEVLTTTTAWQLGTVAARHVELDARSGTPDSLETSDIAAVASALDDVPLPLRREKSAVLFGDLRGPGVTAILVPDTDPVIVEIESEALGRQTVRVPRGQVVRVETGDRGSVSIYTARGTRYALAGRSPAPSAERTAEGSDADRAVLTSIDPLDWAASAPMPHDPDAIDQMIARLSTTEAPSAENLQALARMLLEKYLLEGDTADLDGAVEADQQALAAGPPTVDLLTDLANALHYRFTRTGNPQDLAEATSAARQAVDLTSMPERDALLALAGILFSRFRITAELAAIDEALALSRDAAAITPQDDPAFPVILTRIAEVLYARFIVTGEPGEIDEAIELISTAVSLIPPGHPELGAMLNNLANALLMRFTLRTDAADVDRSVDLLRQSAAITAPSSPQRPTIIAALATALRTRFHVSGNLADLDEAVTSARSAVAGVPQGDVSRAAVLSALGAALQERFAATDMISDLDEAIRVARNAASDLPDGHADRPAVLANLAGVLHLRFGRTGQPADLDEASAAAQAAVASCPPRSPYRPTCLVVLADQYFSRYLLGGNGDDIARAISAVREAVDLVPSGSPDRAAVLLSLAEMLHAEFRHADLPERLEEGISVARAALDAAPSEAPIRARAASGLADLLRDRYARDRVASTAAEAIDLWRSAVGIATGPASVRLSAAVSWAQFAVSLDDWRSALAGYQAAVGLLPLASWRGATAEERASVLGRYAELGRDAAACAIQAGQPERALELLEQGRGIFWNHALEAQADLARLRDVAPELAERLDAIRRRLDAAERVLPDPVPGVPQPPQARTADERYSLARDWDQLVASVRAIRGFASFLQAPSFNDLLAAARDGPVVVVNVSRIRCDALLLTSYGLRVHPLRVDYETVARVVEDYSQVWRDPGARPNAERNTRAEEVLNWLWLQIVQPVLAELGLTAAMEGAPPRLWWCPTGPLTELPLHAAGLYRGRERTENAMYRVCSSYIPTVRALLEARKAAPPRGDDSELLIVANPQAPGVSPLPAAERESAAIRSLLHRTLVLARADATRNAVLAELDRASAVHFVGHAIQTPDPARSGLILSDGILTVAEIAAMRSPAAAFAYLSACDSARTDRTLPDVVTLAAAFHIAGYQNVIAVLDVVSDLVASQVSIDVYQRLTDGRGYLRPEGSAQALRSALLSVLSQSDELFVNCSAFIHIGP